MRDLRRPEQALASYDKAIALNPRFAEAYNNRGNALLDLKRFEKALMMYNKAITLKPDYVVAYNNRGNLLLELKRAEEACASYDQAIVLRPHFAEAYNNRGNALLELKRPEEALSSYNKAIALKVDYVEAYNNRGNALMELRRTDEALASYDRAITLKPDYASAWHGRGVCFFKLKRYNDAFSAYDKALSLKPTLAEAWQSRGLLFCALNRNDEALYAYDKALELKPDLFDVYFKKAVVHLSLGNFEEGLPLYEWRGKSNLFTSPLRDLLKPLWLGGENIKGKTIWVHSEQGLGDTIQFYRYIQKLESLDCNIIFETQAPLLSLIKSQNSKFQVVSYGAALRDFDVHCPLLSLPLAFKTTLATIPARAPYLIPSVEKVELWRGKLGEKKKFRIGLAWSGNPNFANADSKRIPFEMLSSILCSEAEWYSLQKDVRESDRKHLESCREIVDHTRALYDFSDTAALIGELDLVISIDTAVAHLAGALGKPVWILLPFYSDFRWLRDREDSPWYPTARLIRQVKDGEWSQVLERLSQEIRRVLNE